MENSERDILEYRKRKILAQINLVKEGCTSVTYMVGYYIEHVPVELKLQFDQLMISHLEDELSKLEI